MATLPSQIRKVDGVLVTPKGTSNTYVAKDADLELGQAGQVLLHVAPEKMTEGAQIGLGEYLLRFATVELCGDGPAVPAWHQDGPTQCNSLTLYFTRQMLKDPMALVAYVRQQADHIERHGYPVRLSDESAVEGGTDAP